MAARNATINNADLTGVDLFNADVSGANLSNAYLTRTNLTRKILTAACSRPGSPPARPDGFGRPKNTVGWALRTAAHPRRGLCFARC
ncbi:MAG: pentapeptide repeat-containing protein [Acidimicrobiaceae bacterium]|nr:pentapeptide repeat-containing protein [Acidimicrobiaceae bacterium]MBT6443651.1 pentapeptide repeat-containing protein [Acidimicrobiaceae bacterium]